MIRILAKFLAAFLLSASHIQALERPEKEFQVFDPLDFLAEVTQHIPDRSEHLVRYYGW